MTLKLGFSSIPSCPYQRASRCFSRLAWRSQNSELEGSPEAICSSLHQKLRAFCFRILLLLMAGIVGMLASAASRCQPPVGVPSHPGRCSQLSPGCQAFCICHTSSKAPSPRSALSVCRFKQQQLSLERCSSNSRCGSFSGQLRWLCGGPSDTRQITCRCSSTVPHVWDRSEC